MIDISVVVPCYNRIELLKLTIKSASRAIEGLNAEIILVDDGSEPAISSLLDEPEFKALPITNIRHSNSGLVYTKYVGMLAARGRYIQFLDSDDHIAADKLAEQVSAMDKADADVSYTDLLMCDFTGAGDLLVKSSEKIGLAQLAPDFYIGIQPAPHNPVFKRSYLMRYLAEPIIKVNRIYDAIGEVWMYYNLSVYPAKIIKIDKPLTIIVHHQQERITDHWENLGLAALAIQTAFAEENITEQTYTAEARKIIALAAFNTFRGLPYDVNFSFQAAFVRAWRQLGGPKPPGGSKFNLLSKILGPVPAAVIMKLLLGKRYSKIRTISDEEFKRKLNLVLPSGNGKK